MSERKEISSSQERQQPRYNQAPTGHKIPEGRSPDDPNMSFEIPDCGVKAGGEFMHPFVIDTRDLPTPEGNKKNRQGF